MEIFGDGPDREKVLRQVAEHGLEDVVDVPGFVPEERIDAALRRALCLVLPSRREGYGLVVIEAAARGVPSIVVRSADNAATELVNASNGLVADTSDPATLGAAIVQAQRRGQQLRVSASRWFIDNREALGIRSSIDRVLPVYGKGK
jgi:glycosyltransferase involved in cell wall biosynthesis